MVKFDNGSWGHRDGTPFFLPWGPKDPKNHPEYIYAQIWYNDQTPMIYVSMGLWDQEVLCISDNPKDYRMTVKLLGLCDVSTFDKEYVFSYEEKPNDWRGEYTYVGRLNSDIKFMGEGIWRLRI